MKPINDNDFTPARGRHPAELAEYELPEWLAQEQQAQRERESIDRARIGIAALVVMLCGLIAMSAIANYAGGGA